MSGARKGFVSRKAERAAGDDLVGQTLHLALAALIAGIDLLGFLAQATGLGQIVADALGALVQQAADDLRHAVVKQDADEHQKRQRHDKVGVAQREERPRRGQRRMGGKGVTIGVHRKEKGAFYATPVEYGHGGPAPAPAHPFVRPAFDTRVEEAYDAIKQVLRDELSK